MVVRIKGSTFIFLWWYVSNFVMSSLAGRHLISASNIIITSLQRSSRLCRSPVSIKEALIRSSSMCISTIGGLSWWVQRNSTYLSSSLWWFPKYYFTCTNHEICLVWSRPQCNWLCKDNFNKWIYSNNTIKFVTKLLCQLTVVHSQDSRALQHSVADR